jgi:hypothetical protein
MGCRSWFLDVHAAGVSKQRSVEMQNVFHTLAVPALARLYPFIATPLAVDSVPLINTA